MYIKQTLFAQPANSTHFTKLYIENKNSAYNFLSLFHTHTNSYARKTISHGMLYVVSTEKWIIVWFRSVSESYEYEKNITTILFSHSNPFQNNPMKPWTVQLQHNKKSEKFILLPKFDTVSIIQVHGRMHTPTTTFSDWIRQISVRIKKESNENNSLRDRFFFLLLTFPLNH